MVVKHAPLEHFQVPDAGRDTGYVSVLEGARALGARIPMLATAAGTVEPARMIALDAGVAGLQAIATARRLGAVVHGFDARAAAHGGSSAVEKLVV